MRGLYFLLGNGMPAIIWGMAKETPGLVLEAELPCQPRLKVHLSQSLPPTPFI